LYDIENGIYASGAGGVVEGAINLLTLVFSLLALRWTWVHRRSLVGD